MFQKERRKLFGRFRNRETGRMIRVGAARAMIE
jgi:hypothetical protein